MFIWSMTLREYQYFDDLKKNKKIKIINIFLSGMISKKSIDFRFVQHQYKEKL